MSPDEMGFDRFVFPPELVAFMTGKAGVRKGFKVAEFVTLWGIVSDELGREPTRDEFIARWDESVPTWYRRMEHLHAVWPDDRSPERVWQWQRGQLLERAVRQSRRAASA
ncbi:MAG: hypothetical protein WAL61_11785 [Acidimicrobiales bacterium]